MPTAAIAILLAFAAGATDAFAFLQLSGVFTANMTGNLVLAGLVDRPGYATSIIGIVTAVVVFAGTLLAAFRLVPEHAPRRRQAALLGAGLGAQVAVLFGWLFTAGSPDAVIPVLIACSSVAMAAQTALAKRIETLSGVTTTYVTGTITSLMADLADHRAQPVVTRVGVIVALVCGASADALLVRVSPALGAALPLVPAVAALLVLLSAPRPLGRRSLPPAG